MKLPMLEDIGTVDNVVSVPLRGIGDETQTTN